MRLLQEKKLRSHLAREQDVFHPTQRCPLCHDELGGDESRLGVCSSCDTVYHKSCFEELGGCASFACTTPRRRSALQTGARQAPAEPRQ